MGDVMWTGPAVALVTMFDDDGALLADVTAAHAARLVGAGMQAVLVAGSTGEAAALSDSERTDLVAAVRAACPGVPVVAGASGDWWAQAAERTAACIAAGADGVLVAPPRLGGALDVYYGKVADAAGGAPVLAYHYPGVAGGEVPVDALPELPLAGLKDSSGIPARLAAEIELDRPEAVYTGSSALTGYARWLGATGAILAVANLLPEEAVAAWEGDAAAQRALIRTEQAYKAKPGGLKAALAGRFGTSPARRLG